MSTIEEAEKLRIIAEGMGYSILDNLYNQWTVTKDKWSYYCEYNPLTNNDQMVEIMERLLDANSIIEFEKSLAVNGTTFLIADATTYEGKTINESVCNAAFEYFKGEL